MESMGHMLLALTLALNVIGGGYCGLVSHTFPEEKMDTSGLIRYAGFNAETHKVQTKDGYILHMHRIPNPGKIPVFLQHGLLCSSADWVMNNINESLGFILAGKGYDVWLGNYRGNIYSKTHVSLDPKSKEFWSFSWDEMAMYDLPAMIDHVLNSTSHKSLYYVGHSMGTTTGFAFFSTRPEYTKKVKMFFALAPVAYLGHIRSPIGYLADVLPFIEDVVDLFEIYDFLPRNKILNILSELFCDYLPSRELCYNAVFLLCGFDKNQLNETRFPVYAAHTPAGTSTQTVLHYAQLVNSKKFTKYDFGYSENMKKYNQASPPSYPLENITTPTVLFWGENDWLADPTDIKLLEPSIKKSIYKTIKVALPSWDHLDFLWGIDANKYVYKQLLEILAINIRKEK